MDVEKIIENEQEWRRYMMTEQKELRKEISELRKELGLFKAKAFGFISVLVGVAESLKLFFGK